MLSASRMTVILPNCPLPTRSHMKAGWRKPLRAFGKSVSAFFSTPRIWCTRPQKSVTRCKARAQHHCHSRDVVEAEKLGLSCQRLTGQGTSHFTASPCYGPRLTPADSRHLIPRILLDLPFTAGSSGSFQSKVSCSATSPHALTDGSGVYKGHGALSWEPTDW